MASLLLLMPAVTTAQSGGAWLQAGAGEARWSTAAREAGRLRYGMLGLRATHDPHGPFAFEGRAGLGRGRDDVGGIDWWNVEGGPSLAGWVGPLRVMTSGTGWAVHHGQDLSYTASGGRLAAAAEWRRGGWLFRGRGEGVTGRWRLRQEERGGPPISLPIPAPILPPGDDPVEARGDLSLFGGGLDAVRRIGPVWLRASTLTYRGSGRVEGGWQPAVEGELGSGFGPVLLAIGTRWVSSPQGDEAGETVGYQARARVDLGVGWALVAQVDSRPWDPLHAVPRGAAAMAMLEWRLWPRGPAGPPVVEVGAWATGGRMVRFRLRHRTASRVDLVGDFTEWQPRPMTRREDIWETAVVLPPGTHHFAFLLDSDAWVVPDHAPGIVEDGWQRKNASIVVPERPR